MFRLPVKIYSIIATSLAACLLASLAVAQNYAAFELRRQDNWSAIAFHDLNGDGGKDIVVPHYQSGLGRELHVYHQQADGSFSNNPQRIEIKTEIIAVDFADLRPEPGLELILFATNGVFSLSPTIEGYTGNLALLFEWDYLATIPNLENVHFVNHSIDFNNDGLVDLLVPGNDRYGVFLGQGGESFRQVGEFASLNPGMTPMQRRNFDTSFEANLAITAERGVVVELSAETPTPFQGFVERWQPDNTDQRLLASEQWMPTATIARLNNDSLPDIAYINAGENGLGQFNMHFQSDGMFASSADWKQSFDSRGDLELADFNGDGLDDLLQLRGDGNDWILSLFVNRGGAFELQSPDQVMRFSGYDVDITIIPRDVAPILNVSYYTIPVVDAIRNASINRIQLLYQTAASGSGEVFARRPASRLEENFSADNVRGLSEQMSLAYDVDGDGNNDALYITANGTLAAKRINADLQIADQAFWEYVSPRSVFEFQILNLNDDELPDLMLRHGNSTTLLVARP